MEIRWSVGRAVASVFVLAAAVAVAAVGVAAALLTGRWKGA